MTFLYESNVVFLHWILTVGFVICRYQPENSAMAYEMANTQDEPEVADLSHTEMLPQPEDRFSIRNLLCPSNTAPSPRSGSVVNICTSILGKIRTRKKCKNATYLNDANKDNLIISPCYRCFGVCLLHCGCSRRA